MVALLALVAQLVLGGVPSRETMRATPDQQLAALLADPAAICDASGGHRAPHHHTVDCALCPYCAAITTAVVLRGDYPTLPMPRAGPLTVAVAAAPGITLPPSPPLAARPRGPPILT